MQYDLSISTVCLEEYKTGPNVIDHLEVKCDLYYFVMVYVCRTYQNIQLVSGEEKQGFCDLR